MDKDNKDKKNLIIRIILIIIIIILLIHNCVLIKKARETAKNKPTGNTDIFEIICNKDSCDDKDNMGNIIIEDKNITWSSENKLRIFENPYYNLEQKIAPGSSNTYKFIIKNKVKTNSKYSITFSEVNNYHINMQYRLKKGNNYVAGSDNSWVSYNGLNLNNLSLNSDSSDEYYLDWRWVSSDNDTHLSGIQDAYKLTIKIEVNN